MGKESRRKKAVLIALSVFVTSFLIGFYIGKARSVDYDDDRTADAYLAVYSFWESVDQSHGQLKLQVEDRTYRYRTGDSKVAVDFLPVSILASESMPKRDLREDAEKMAPLVMGTAEGGLLTTLLVSARAPQPPQSKAILVIGAVTGGAFGYWVGHHSKPNYNTPAFKEMLQSVELWGGIEKELRERYIKFLNPEKNYGYSFPVLTPVPDHPDVPIGYVTPEPRDHPEVKLQALRHRQLLSELDADVPAVAPKSQSMPNTTKFSRR